MNPSQVLDSFRPGGDVRQINGRSQVTHARGNGHANGHRSMNNNNNTHLHPAPRSQSTRVAHEQQPQMKSIDFAILLYDLVVKNNLPSPVCSAVDSAAKKSKFPQFVAKVTIGDKNWKTHPSTFPTKEEAKNYAMAIAYQDLCQNLELLDVIGDETPVSQDTFVHQIYEIVKDEPVGMIDSAVAQEYVKRFKCKVPRNWIELLSSSSELMLSESNVLNKTVRTISPYKPMSPKPMIQKPVMQKPIAQKCDAPPSPTCSPNATDSGFLSPPRGTPEPQLSDFDTLERQAKHATKEDLIKFSPSKKSPRKNGDAISLSNGMKDLFLDGFDGDVLSTKSRIPFAQVPPLTSKDPSSDNSYYDVFCTLAASPSHFWVQPYDNIQIGGVFQRLCREMNSFYEKEDNKIDVPSTLIVKGLALAARIDDGSWCRVIVDTIVPDSDPMEVVCFFLDFGDIRILKLDKLQPLYSQFQVLNRQAVKCLLSNVEPVSGDWTLEHCLKFRNMVEGKPFVSLVKGVHGSDDQVVLHLELIDTTTPEDVDVGKMLVDKELARLK